MKKYRCKKEFSVQDYDEDGRIIENSYRVIHEGAVYTLDDTGCTIIEGEVHLDNIVDGSWLETTKKRLSEYFEEVISEEQCFPLERALIYSYGFRDNSCKQKITYFIAVYDKVHKVWRPRSGQYEEIEEAQGRLDAWKRNHPGSSQKVGIFERIKAEMISEITL